MELLLFRAALAPLLVLLATLVARRLGPRRGGQLLGAPTTTGPFLAVTWLGYGPAKTAAAAHGSVTGTLVVACFCLAYGRLAAGRRPTRTLAAALPCAAGAALVGAGCESVWVSGGLALAVAVVGLRTLPASGASGRPPRPAQRWELPARMLLSGATVLVGVAAANALGPFLGGVVSSLPVLLAIMVPSVHRSAGAPPATDMTRGALSSAVGTLGFLLVLCLAPVRLGPLACLVLAPAAFVIGTSLLRWCALRVASAQPVMGWTGIR
ncbi:hypothetical protein [Kitasatospora viridis]|uniref:Uncharacterized protein n=1 Tax=Kitasatospora viridis TaxID=281105 RepID=A0A561TVF1_9ACTN|nr:hypothetical protein [Kitasatospora viridis]TWF91093.1 hypothetical protein FHX73_12205 [Kitasatospora viridis]